MSLLTEWAGCAFPRRRRRNDQRGYFLIESLLLSFLVLGCAASLMVYQMLARNRAAAAAEITASYLAQEQLARIEAQPASYLRAHGEIPWLGEGNLPLEKNSTEFQISSVVTPHPEYPESLAQAEVRIQWRAAGKDREASYRKLVAYHE